MTMGIPASSISSGSVSTAPLDAGQRPEADLLPSPKTEFDVGDALTTMLKLGSTLTDQQTNASKNSVMSAANARKAVSEKRMQAISDAIEAARKAADEKSSGGMLDFVTDNLGPAGLLGLCTGAAYIVAADVA